MNSKRLRHNAVSLQMPLVMRRFTWKKFPEVQVAKYQMDDMDAGCK